MTTTTAGYRTAFDILLACLVWPLMLAGQTPPPDFDVSVSPPDGSILITETTNLVEVTINNLSSFTNVTVTGTFGSQQNIPFLDDGQPPDQTAADGIFSGDLITPTVRLQATNLTLQLVMSGEFLEPPQDPPPDPPPPPVIVTTTNEVNYIVVPRPENDNFTNAFKILPPGGTILATNNYASLETGEPQHAQVPGVASSVWWTWSPANNADTLIDLSGSSFDAVLAIYRGPTVTNLTPVAFATNDAVLNLRAHVNFDAIAGATYRIAVSGYDTNEVGDIYLRVIPGGQPDTEGPSVVILTPEDNALFTTNIVGFAGTARDVEPGGIGLRRVLLQVNNDDPVEAVGTSNWSVDLDLPPGTNTVSAFGEDIAGNVGPAARIIVRFINPTNDWFDSAIELTELAGMITAINGRATLEAGEPIHAGNEGGRSIWYRFRAPERGTFDLTTENSDFDTLLAVYSGDSLTNLTAVAENDDAVPDSDVEYSELTATLASNVVYYIVVDGYGGESGNIELRFQFASTETYYRLTVSPPLGGQVTPASGLYVADTPLELAAVASPDFEFIGWEGDIVATENPVSVVMTRDYGVDAVFEVKRYTEGFESGELNSPDWSTSGSAPWIVQPGVKFQGGYAAQSGPIGDGRSSSLSLTANLAAGTGAFYLKVSSEEGWDFLEFRVNGIFLKRWSGEISWQPFLFAVREGVNTLEWRYVKDANFSEGLDAAFVDNLYLPFPDGGALPKLTLIPVAQGPIQLQVDAFPNRPHVIEVSSDLIGWIPASTNSSPNGTIQWTDAESVNLPLRYYRVIAP